jgi:Domain of unknown function (DUF1707)
LIPMLLMLVYPGGPGDANPARRSGQRASDTDRDIAADILCAAVVDGRLTLDELDDRLEASLSARTITELAALIADLPGRRIEGPAPDHARNPPARSDALQLSRWSVLQSLADAHPRAPLPAT